MCTALDPCSTARGYQQKLSCRELAIVVLRSNRRPRVRMRIDGIRASVDGIQPGEMKEVAI